MSRSSQKCRDPAKNVAIQPKMSRFGQKCRDSVKNVAPARQPASPPARQPASPPARQPASRFGFFLNYG
jgi:hypothetical protein